MGDQIVIKVSVNDGQVAPAFNRVRDQVKSIDKEFAGSRLLNGKELENVRRRFANLTIPNLGAGGRNLGVELRAGGEGARKLIEGLHALHPVLDGLGIGISNLRSFGAAARFGVLGLAGIVAAVGAIKLEKHAEQLDEVKKSVTDLGASTEDFEKLRKGARNLGVDVGVVGKAFTDFAAARSKASASGIVVNPFGPKGEGTFPGTSPADSLIGILKAATLGSPSPEAAAKDFAAFNESIAKTGRVTPELAPLISGGFARQLLKIFNFAEPAPGSSKTPNDFLAQQLGSSGRSLVELQTKLTQQGPRIDKELAEKPVTIGEGINKLGASINNLAPSFSSLGAAANAAAEFLNRLADAKAPEAGVTAEDISKATRQTPPGLASGGVISGPGSGTSDSILGSIVGGGSIRVSNGEGIVNARGMRRIGLSGLNTINGYADGGAIGGAGSTPVGIVHLKLGDTVYQASMPRDAAEEFVQRSVDYRIASGGRRQSAIS